MLKKISEYAKKNRLFERCGHIVLGLSGGADSVCLLEVLCRLKEENGYEITAVHIHHGIRGKEADRDLEFCRNLCRNKDIEFRQYHFNVPLIAEETGESIEEAGRRIRYNSFAEAAADYENCVIAVAHHANDRAETILFNIIRGTGIRGMCTMMPKRDNIIRPMLCCTRSEIEDFLSINNISFINDSTNMCNDYARNKLRNNVIPCIEEINSAAVRNIGSMAERMLELKQFTEDITDKFYAEAVSAEKNGILIRNLPDIPPYIYKNIIIRVIKDVYTTLKDITEIHINRIRKLSSDKPGTYINIKGELYVLKETDGLFFYCKSGNNGCVHGTSDTGGRNVEIPSTVYMDDGLRFNFFTIMYDKHKKITNQVYTKYFDYDKITFGLQLRSYQPGDYIVVDKEGHRKKINRYFIDEKIPQRKRDGILLLADGNHIVWVVGHRISEACKVTEATNTILCVEYGDNEYA